jgi:hypothetical protein
LGVNLGAIGIGSDARNLYEVQRWSATSGGVLILVEDVAELLLCAVDDGEEDELVFPLARFLKPSKRYGGSFLLVGWTAPGPSLWAAAEMGVGLLRWLRSTRVSFPLFLLFKFCFYIFCFSIFWFEFKLISICFCRS